MKKTISTIALLATIGLAVPLTVFAGWGGNGPGSCWTNSNNSGTTATESKEAVEARKKFYADTTETRKAIALKQVELSTLFNTEAPDPAAVKTLQSELYDLNAQLGKKAIEAGIEGRGFGGYGGYGMMGDGYGMMGNGYGRGSRTCWNN